MLLNACSNSSVCRMFWGGVKASLKWDRTELQNWRNVSNCIFLPFPSCLLSTIWPFSSNTMHPPALPRSPSGPASVYLQGRIKREDAQSSSIFLLILVERVLKWKAVEAGMYSHNAPNLTRQNIAGCSRIYLQWRWGGKAAARHLPAKQASLTGASGAAHTQLIFLSAY